MTPERWQRIEELFHSALAREARTRAGFLATACVGDGELRQQVEALLDSLEEAGDFIEEAPLAGAVSSIAAESAAEAARQTASGAPFIGRRISHYEIQSLLGAGGMGEVYLAHDLNLDRQIAIKILPSQFTKEIAQVQRFEREARAASALNHPNIITVHEIGWDQDTHFIATEFVAGPTLREKMAGGKMLPKEALSIAIQIADALTAAHAAGIVHRDIKPENIMVRPDGLVKVLDFGLAKPTARALAQHTGPTPTTVTMHTDPEMLMGTIAYLSPEQALRQEVDRRTDIFSLGVVLYEMIAGARPFTGNSAAAVCDAILRDSPNSISRAACPPALKRIISRALEKRREQRYQTADAMRNDLQRLTLKEYRASPDLLSGWRVAATVAAVALATVAVMLTMALRRETVSEGSLFSTGSVRRITAAAGWEGFPSLSPDGQVIVYASRANGNWDIYRKKIGEAQTVNLTADS
ncbi:MAG: protein kinase, partial [Acidobacteria bacterium]|nr:protein kinase [Acidobacteriota bacterium]